MLAAIVWCPTASWASETSEAAIGVVHDETRFALDTLSLLVSGALVMWMCAGFTLLEAGSVRSKSASVICLKHIGLYSTAGFTFFAIGYNCMFAGVEGGPVGTLQFLVGPSEAEVSVLADSTTAISELLSVGHAEPASWFFQKVFVGTTASIVSGAIAEMIKLLALLAVMTAFPTRSWTLGPEAGGWLTERDFQDSSPAPQWSTAPAAGLLWPGC